MFELKRIKASAVPAALERAKRYRLLNEPSEAESICRDVLDVEPGNREAQELLLLSLTDQFRQHGASLAEDACRLADALDDEYKRLYYRGLVFERRAKAQLRRGGPHVGYMAYDWLVEAMKCYEQAQALRPPENDESILRWNACVRTFERHPDVVPEPEDNTVYLLE